MAGIGVLVGFLKLDDAQYNRAAKAASVTARAVASGITQAFVRVAAPTVLAAKLFSLGRTALNLADDFDELATRTGATFEGIQVLGQLARNTGQNAEIFTKGIDHLNTSLAEAEKGSLKAYAPLRQLGLTLKEFEGLTAERKLELVAKASVAAKDKAQALLAVQELLGTKSTPQLRDALNQLARGYDTVRDNVEETGLLINEKFRQDLAEAKREIEDFQGRIVIAMGKGLAAVKKGVDEIRAANTAPLSAAAQEDNTRQAVADIVSRAFAVSSESAREILAAEFRNRIQEMQAIVQSQTLAQIDQRSPITPAERARLQGDLTILNALLTTLGDIEDTEFGKIIAENAALATAAAKAEAEARAKAAAAAAAEAERLRLLAREKGIAKTGAEELTVALVQLKRAQEEGSISAEAYARAVLDARDNAQVFRSDTEEARTAVRHLNEAWQDSLISAQNYSRAYQDILLNLRPIKDPLEQYREELTKLDRLQKDSAISAVALALGIRDAARAVGSFNLGKLNEGIEALAGGKAGGTNLSRSAQRSLDRAQQNAARGNLGAARADLRRVNELTGGREITTVEDLLAPKGVGPLAPITPPEKQGAQNAEGEKALVGKVGELVEVLTGIGKTLTVAK